MGYLGLSKWVTVISMVAGMAILGSGAARAQCYGPQAQLSPALVSSFTASPTDLLKLSNAQLISEVRDLVASSPPALQLVVGLLNSASSAQASAIGTGLGEAAMICVRTDRAFAVEIQNIIATISNADLTTAFSAVLGDQPIGAVGTSAAAGPGGGTGPVNPIGGPTGFFGTSNIFGNFATKNIGVDYFTSQNSVGSVSVTVNSVINNSAGSVSPAQ